MKAIFCGSRHWNNLQVIENVIIELAPNHIIHGNASGADSVAGLAGQRLDIIVTAVPAQWEKYGRSAGPIRNSVMLDMKPDLVVAFHDHLPKSKGTKNMVLLSLWGGEVEVMLYDSSGTQFFPMLIKGGKLDEFSCTRDKPGKSSRLI